MGLQLLYLLGLLASTQHEHACGKRVKSACVAHLHLAALLLGTEKPDVGQGSEAAHAVGLVDGYYLAFLEVHI